jgi:hypothetical protein
MSAGQNEKDFRERTKTGTKYNILEKKSFRKGIGQYISVDGYFVYNNKLYLVEIDSGNESKLLAGQYILLNALFEPITIEEKTYNIDECVFLVIHYFKDYSPERTINALNLLKEKYSLSLNFKVFHQQTISNWQDLLNKL